MNRLQRMRIMNWLLRRRNNWLNRKLQRKRRRLTEKELAFLVAFMDIDLELRGVPHDKPSADVQRFVNRSLGNRAIYPETPDQPA